MEENTNVNVNETTEVVETTPQEETKTYTQEEVMKLIQAESDRRTNQALAK